ncbi:SDR family NAD(P)-dependent oxidoreductase [Streptomyces sp. ME02-8801-2C]|uniref:SDR family NAD(P)-dependent oxidoreductase n=1 Tax=Streptomyces sp. ME02-8801-2C TaxID=3028680 RepID=UPI0029A5E366|nr:SDR family oxidoreductase [Streptomyces sp. ME02-8801-2C]MDX3453350.1 SDR family NAD(P)-dependent oxidoreductase [Streptomyces sp. ME02-8801-2C]
MSTLLSGKTALITGSTSGIGRATADLLAERGAHVIVSGRNAERGAQAVADIREAGGKADFVQADLTSADSARTLAEQARSVTGRIDILVNNAAVFPEGGTTDTPEEVFDTVYATNVKVPFFLVGELVPAMAERGAGAVVNISSFVADKAAPDRAAYSSSKAALNNLTKAWAKEYGPSGVRVNSVAPGPVLPEEIQAAVAADPRAAAVTQALPARRFGLPREIAEAVAYLASDEAAFAHGAFLSVDGGAGLA